MQHKKQLFNIVNQLGSLSKHELDNLEIAVIFLISSFEDIAGATDTGLTAEQITDGYQLILNQYIETGSIDEEKLKPQLLSLLSQ